MTVMDVEGPLAPDRVDELCRRALALLQTASDDLVCDVRAVAPPDARAVDALARLHLELKRSGFDLRIRGACDRLRELIALMGLEDVLVVEPRR